MNPIHDLIPVPVRGKTLFVGGETDPLVPIKPVSEHLGLAWQVQHRKLKTHPSLAQAITTMVIPSDGGPQEMVCLSAFLLPAFLMSIHPDRVAPRARELLIAFQREASRALYEAWLGARQGFPAPLVKSGRPEASLLARVEQRPRSLEHPAFLRAQALWAEAGRIEAEAFRRAEQVRDQARGTMRQAGFTATDFRALRALAAAWKEGSQPSLDLDGEGAR